MKNPDHDADFVPLEGQLRYYGDVLQRYEWSSILSDHDWFDVPKIPEGEST